MKGFAVYLLFFGCLCKGRLKKRTIKKWTRVHFAETPPHNMVLFFLFLPNGNGNIGIYNINIKWWFYETLQTKFELFPHGECFIGVNKCFEGGLGVEKIIFPHSNIPNFINLNYICIHQCEFLYNIYFERIK